jgi:hypothetical protein
VEEVETDLDGVAARGGHAFHEVVDERVADDDAELARRLARSVAVALACSAGLSKVSFWRRCAKIGGVPMSISRSAHPLPMCSLIMGTDLPSKAPGWFLGSHLALPCGTAAATEASNRNDICFITVFYERELNTTVSGQQQQ